MKCKCDHPQYCRLGFNMMDWSDPCKAGLTDIPVETTISQGGELSPPAPPASIAKKGGIPWWLIIAGGYLLYREGQGL
jgi:hypothetical protein